MKKMIFLLLVVSMTNVVIANEIPEEIENPLIWREEKIVVSDEFKKLCTEYEEPLDELRAALEKCAQANEQDYFEPCSQCLPIMAKPEHDKFYFQMKKRARFYVRDKKKADKFEAAVRKKIGNELFEKMEMQDDLLRSCNNRLSDTLEKMRSEIDLSAFNAQLPQSLSDICGQSQDRLVKSRCSEIQKMFQRREADLRGEYSPFSAKFDRGLIVPGNDPVNLDDIKKNVIGLCNHLQLSEQTRSQLVQLTMDGYSGNGKCEKGPILNVQLEQAQWELEKDQRKEKGSRQD